MENENGAKDVIAPEYEKEFSEQWQKLIRSGERWTSSGRSYSADRNGVETEYMTLQMRDLENQEIGKEQGINKEQHERIAMMLQDGKTPKEIADFCKYPLALVNEIQESLLAKAL